MRCMPRGKSRTNDSACNHPMRFFLSNSLSYSNRNHMIICPLISNSVLTGRYSFSIIRRSRFHFSSAKPQPTEKNTPQPQQWRPQCTRRRLRLCNPPSWPSRQGAPTPNSDLLRPFLKLLVLIPPQLESPALFTPISKTFLGSSLMPLRLPASLLPLPLLSFRYALSLLMEFFFDNLFVVMILHALNLRFAVKFWIFLVLSTLIWLLNLVADFD